jgi:Protein of unknown function (DUF3592)
MTSFGLLVLGSVSLILLFVGLYWLVLVIRRHPRLVRISGTVLTVEKKQEIGADNVTFYPTIAYDTPDGTQVRFRSNAGVTRPIRKLSGQTTSPWRAGQSIDVFHDPSGVMGPCIASLWNLYIGPAGFIVGGVLLLIVVANKWLHVG